MSRMTHSRALLWMVAILACALGLGCDDAAVVKLVPVFPIDPNSGQPYTLAQLQTKLSFDRIEVVLTPMDTEPPATTRTLEVAVGQGLELRDLEEGWWSIEVSALSAAEEKLFGESAPFEVRRGQQGRVEFPVGISFGFNLMSWKTATATEAFRDLEAAAAVAYKDETGRQLILVTGGRRGDQGPSLDQALLVDTSRFEVIPLPPLPEPRAGHRALLLDTTGPNPRIAFFGGDRGHPSVLVYDGATRTFRSIDVHGSCGQVETTDAAFLVGGLTGQLIIPGQQHCIVDTLSGEVYTSDELFEPGPSATAISAENSVGGVALIDGGAVYAESALVGNSCRATAQGAADAVWDHAAHTLDDQQLWVLNNDPFHRFLVVGRHEDRLGWKLVGITITASSCMVGTVDEGLLNTGTARTDMGFLELPLNTRFDSGDLSPQGAALLTGGRDASGKVLDDVVLFVDGNGANNKVSGAVFLPLSSSLLRSPLRLSHPRAGHLVVPVGPRSVWILGGEHSGAPEIFTLGRGMRLSDYNTYNVALTLRSIKPQARKPGLRFATVIDTTTRAAPLREALLNTLPKVLRSSALLDHIKSSQDISFLAITSDIGLLDDDLWPVVENQASFYGCGHNAQYELPGMLSIPQLSNDQRVEQAIGDLVPKLGSLEHPISNQGCNLKQTMKVMLDGLANSDKAPQLESTPKGLPLAPADPGSSPGKVDLPEGIGEERARTDITIALLPVVDDDCSQGVVTPLDTSVLNPGVLNECGSAAYDSFFALPPTGEGIDQLQEQLAESVNRPENLAVIALGNIANVAGCGFIFESSSSANAISSVSLGYPRRLLGTLETLANADVATSAVEICSLTFTNKSFEERVRHAVVREVARLDTLLACVPPDYAVVADQGDTTDFELFEASDADALIKNLSQRCQFFLAPTAASEDSTVHTVQTLFEPGRDFRLRPRAQTTLSCEGSTEWAIEFSAESLWLASGSDIVTYIEAGAEGWDKALEIATEERKGVAILCVD